MCDRKTTATDERRQHSNVRRFHGWHWWRGISNEIDCNGKRLAVAKWYAVHCWTAKGVPMALSAHWTAPMQQDDMRGEWGPEIIPPNKD